MTVERAAEKWHTRRPVSAGRMDKKVPVISLDQTEAAAAEEVRRACTRYGFFAIKDHGVPEELVDAALRENERFFALPLEQKMTCKINADYRGYAHIGAEVLDYGKKTKGDSKEGMYYGIAFPPGTPGAEQPLMGNNQWPDEAVLPGHRAVMEQYLAEMIRLGNRLNRLLALALDMPPEAFDEHFTWPRAGVRMLRYAPVPSDPEQGQFGAGAHTDYGMLTILKTDMTGGLQIKLDDWIDIEPIASTFVVNLGDMFERWTNGRFRSTLHRVMTSNQERRSLAFFYDPAFNVRVEVLPQCCTAENPPRYPPTTSGEHLIEKLSKSYAGMLANEA